MPVPEGDLRTLAALERIATALERALALQEAIDSGECDRCEGGKLLVLRRAGEMPVLMTCGYCRGTGKADG